MISLLPRTSETLVVAFDGGEARRRINQATTKELLTQNQIKDRRILFTGVVSEEQFSISLKITRPNSFIPLVLGRIESASMGCIVFMRFRLFPGTRAYLIFWLSFVIIAGAVITYEYDSLIPVLLAAGLDASILWISWANFRLQVRFTRRAIEQVLGP